MNIDWTGPTTPEAIPQATGSYPDGTITNDITSVLDPEAAFDPGFVQPTPLLNGPGALDDDNDAALLAEVSSDSDTDEEDVSPDPEWDVEALWESAFSQEAGDPGVVDPSDPMSAFGAEFEAELADLRECP